MTTLRDLEASELGLSTPESDPAQIYIDMVKRMVLNVVYEDIGVFVYDHKNEPQVTDDYSLKRRLAGEDKPLVAHTMIGWQRLNNIQSCIEDVIKQQIPGDIVETGVLRGGASIFARAVLKAHNDTSRKVVCCDTFVRAPGTPKLLAWIIEKLASIPSRRWQYKFLQYLHRVDENKSFPDDLNPGDGWAQFMIWYLQNLRAMERSKGANLEDVKMNFARYGLLDEQVMFLEGFFADTLPTAPIEHVAVLRLDGDTYDSTMDAIHGLYPKLSVGGYCIVDDYHAFPGCKRAIEDYRTQHGIQTALQPIDNLAIYWQKEASELLANAPVEANGNVAVVSAAE